MPGQDRRSRPPAPSGQDPILPPGRRRGRSRRRSLLAQVLTTNLLLVAGAVVVTSVALTGQGQSIGVIGSALVATIAGNLLLLRARFRPLEELVARMEEVDLSARHTGVPLPIAGSDEVSRINAAFNGMLARLEQERRRAGISAIRAQERERQRIAQDLHDEVNQALTAILLRVEATSQRAPDALRPELAETKRLATQAMEELLQLARQLRPTVLDDHGLVAALRTQVRLFGDQTGLRASFRTKGSLPRLSHEQQLALYRVCQEGLSNVAQHADASSVEVELSFVGRTLLTITDDGRGFAAPRRGGLGLAGMRERAMLAGGDLHIWSRPSGGTRVELSIGRTP